MGSPDARQIDGMGGADPLTSKIAIIKPSTRQGVDIDYLFLQVFVDQAIVGDAQNCGNMLAAVAPFAIERGLVLPRDDETSVSIFMENTAQIAVARVQTPSGTVSYTGSARIDGVPGTASPIPIAFRDTAGSSCGALLPTGNVIDMVDGVEVTCIDNGMPTIVMRAADMGIDGCETRETLDANDELKARVESIRLQLGPRMNLGDVRAKSIPKMTLVSSPRAGGTIATRTFIPHRCHASIGVLGAVSVATACMLPDSCATALTQVGDQNAAQLRIEHPSGELTVLVDTDTSGAVVSAAVVRTARKLFDGVVFVD
jgi:4-oxalomesaconate tautomerase